MINEPAAEHRVLRVLRPLWAMNPAAVPEPDGGVELTVVVSARAIGDPATRTAINRLAAAGLPMLGLVDLAYATRPPAEIRDDLQRLPAVPVGEVLLDRAPTSPYGIGLVALAVRAARRAGLAEVILNPGLPADPVYGSLGTAICTFEGTWTDYRRMSDAAVPPAGGHLVHGVPAGELATLWRLMRRRGAAFGFATGHRPPHPYGLAEPPGILAGAH
jgi:hypothetical protein